MKIRLLALSSAALLATAVPALAGDGFYIGLGAGWSKPSSVDYSLGAGSGNIGYENGARFDFASGYKWANGLRLELDSPYARYNVQNATSTAGALIAGASGHGTMWGLLGNLVYDFNIAPRLNLSFGGGLGAARFTSAYTDPTELVRGGKVGFAYQLIGGLTWEITPRVDLELDYRYLSLA